MKRCYENRRKTCKRRDRLEIKINLQGKFEHWVCDDGMILQWTITPSRKKRSYCLP